MKAATVASSRMRKVHPHETKRIVLYRHEELVRATVALTTSDKTRLHRVDTDFLGGSFRLAIYLIATSA